MATSMNIGLDVKFTPLFEQWLKNYPIADQIKIADFILHVRQYGFSGLQGRNKSSDHVPKDDPNWSERVSYAQKYHLWHYHIGIPCYIKSEQGDYVSEYLLHYMKYDDYIILVDMTPHPPFHLPPEQYLI